MDKKGARVLQRTLAYPKLKNNQVLINIAPRGFTLIELMVVITVIAILAGVVLFNVNFNSDKRNVQTTARQLQQLAQVASDEALQLDRLLGIELFTDGYRFLEWVEPEQGIRAPDQAAAPNNGSDLQTKTAPIHNQGLPQAGYWGLLQGDKFLKQQRFKQNNDVVVELEMANSRIELLPMDTATRVNEKKLDNKKKRPSYQPHLIFSPSGEAEDFTLTVSAKNDSHYKFVLRGDVLGKLLLQEPGKDEE